MQAWLVPTIGALLCWGLWGFIPKLTTRYLDSKSAIVFEVVGAIVLGIVMLSSLHFRPDTHPKGVALAITTGMLGFLGAFCFLNALTKGPVTLVATISAFYPVISIALAMVVFQETVTLRQGIGIVLALVALGLIAA